MNSLEKSAFAWAVLLVGAIITAAGLGAWLAGCSSTPHPDPRAAQFGLELQLCIQGAQTRLEADECRADVERRYGHPQSTDGGVDQ